MGAATAFGSPLLAALEANDPGTDTTRQIEGRTIVVQPTWVVVPDGEKLKPLHVAFAAFCATIVSLAPAASIAAAMGVIAIAWSRLVLKRHTLAEVALGALIGAAAGLALRLWR